MTSLAAAADPHGPADGHVRVRVFGGPDPDHRALLGALVCTPDEAAALCARVNRTGQADPVVVFPIAADEAYRIARALNAAGEQALSRLVVDNLGAVARRRAGVS